MRLAPLSPGARVPHKELGPEGRQTPQAEDVAVVVLSRVELPNLSDLYDNL